MVINLDCDYNTHDSNPRHLSHSVTDEPVIAVQDTNPDETDQASEEDALNVIERAKLVSQIDPFMELTTQYYYSTKWVSSVDHHAWGYLEYDVEGETSVVVDMDIPRPCSYSKYTRATKKYEPIVFGGSSSSDTKTSEVQVEDRGITLRQLRAVWANIVRRCEDERWMDDEGNLLTPETVTFYDANKYIIKPFTVGSKNAFVSCLPSTAGTQPPRFVASCWFGETMANFISCIEQLVRDFGSNMYDEDDQRGGGMTADTPIWVCAFASNQWQLANSLTFDSKKSGFVKAMQVTNGRNITILDGKGKIFSRIWCIYELFLTLGDAQESIAVSDPEVDVNEEKSGMWAIYTAQSHMYEYGKKKENRDAVGIIAGGATSDDSLAEKTEARERAFPFSLMLQSFVVRVESAQATNELDRVRILNSIVGRVGDALNDHPFVTHEQYDEVNYTLKALFASVQSNLQAASRDSDEVWMKILLALSKGNKGSMGFWFDFEEDGWRGLTADRAIQLVAHLPPTVTDLWINYASFGKGFVEAVIQHVAVSSSLRELNLRNTVVSGKEEGRELGVRLADVLSTNNTITSLNLQSTDLLVSANVKEWEIALNKNTTLTTLLQDNFSKELSDATSGRTPYLTVA